MKVLQASVSFSGISPAVEFNNTLYFAGNAIYENDVMAAVNHCEALGYDEKDIIIDSIVGGSTELSFFNPELENSFGIMRRASELWKFYDTMHGVMRAKNGHPDVNFRYVIGPTFTMPSKFLPMQYTLSETHSLMDHGERDANRAIVNLLQYPEDELEKRLNHPTTLRYYNQTRQQKYIDAMKASFDLFIKNETNKVLEAGHPLPTHELLESQKEDLSSYLQ